MTNFFKGIIAGVAASVIMFGIIIGFINRRACGLCFIHPDDEGFTLRGDKKRLVYKGQRRSHRFTILGDTAFEYDCILERESDSNVISLLLYY
ncbi:hypothetical protein FACS189485_21400 [Spirochaetia bacterium]|nr:hypothetical protein FACS189485_21400 [Spirochaetia bacterium]